MTVRRGDVWLAEFDPVRHNEQGGTRPCVVMSGDGYNSMPINMAIVVPVTTRDRRLSHEPRLVSTGSGLDRRPSFARPEDVRAISTTRMIRRLGQVSAAETRSIADVLRLFLDQR